MILLNVINEGVRLIMSSVNKILSKQEYLINQIVYFITFQDDDIFEMVKTENITIWLS